MKLMRKLLKETGFQELKSKNDYCRVGLSFKEDRVDEKRYKVWYYIDKVKKAMIVYDQKRNEWDVTFEENRKRQPKGMSYIIAGPVIPEFKRMFYGFKRNQRMD